MEVAVTIWVIGAMMTYGGMDAADWIAKKHSQAWWAWLLV